MGDNDFILDGIRWSYSSVSTYDSCPQAFKYLYLDVLPRADNAFAEWGTLMHSIMERYFKGELEFYELSEAYEQEYDKSVKSPFPPNKFVDLAESYHKKGRDYLDHFDGIFNDCKVVGVEERVEMDINGYPFVGVIDLLLKDTDGEYIVADHKSKSKFNNDAEKAEYARQLYLYAHYVKEKFGRWPKMLAFHMVRNNGELVKIPFNIEDAIKAARWFATTIDQIYKDERFISTPDVIHREMDGLKMGFDMGQIGFGAYTKEKKKLITNLNGMKFYCEELCSAREFCEYGRSSKSSVT